MKLNNQILMQGTFRWCDTIDRGAIVVQPAVKKLVEENGSELCLFGDVVPYYWKGQGGEDVNINTLPTLSRTDFKVAGVDNKSSSVVLSSVIRFDRFIGSALPNNTLIILASKQDIRVLSKAVKNFTENIETHKELSERIAHNEAKIEELKNLAKTRELTAEESSLMSMHRSNIETFKQQKRFMPSDRGTVAFTSVLNENYGHFYADYFLKNTYPLFIDNEVGIGFFILEKNNQTPTKMSIEREWVPALNFGDTNSDCDSKYQSSIDLIKESIESGTIKQSHHKEFYELLVSALEKGQELCVDSHAICWKARGEILTVALHDLIGRVNIEWEVKGMSPLFKRGTGSQELYTATYDKPTSIPFSINENDETVFDSGVSLIEPSVGMLAAAMSSGMISSDSDENDGIEAKNISIKIKDEDVLMRFSMIPVINKKKERTVLAGGVSESVIETKTVNPICIVFNKDTMTVQVAVE